MRHLFVAATLTAGLPFANLPGQFEKIAPAAQGRVGVAAQLLESGDTASLHGDEHFPMHSVYKLLISMAVLQRVDRGELKLDQLMRVEPGAILCEKAVWCVSGERRTILATSCRLPSPSTNTSCPFTRPSIDSWRSSTTKAHPGNRSIR